MTVNMLRGVVPLLMGALAGCATLPSSGPTGPQIRATAAQSELAFRIVDIDRPTIDTLAAVPPVPPPPAGLDTGARIDAVGPGDVLDINIYEVGITLFGGGSGGATGASFDPSARVTKLGDVVVDAEGTILLPYIGRLAVAGTTPAQIQRAIERGLRGKSQSPQALVSVKTNAFNTFYVSGDVRNPGRYTLGLPRERLLDALARAGGTTNQPNDMVVRMTRDAGAFEARLSDIVAGGALDLPLSPGDRVELFNRPRTFLIFGATDKVAQVPFGASTLTLAEALARSGGPSERIADPAAIFLFRQATAEAVADSGAKPVIYRLDMTRAESFILSQQFQLQDKDVIYIANARANAPTKLSQILGQLFSPFLAVRAVVGN